MNNSQSWPIINYNLTIQSELKSELLEILLNSGENNTKRIVKYIIYQKLKHITK